MSSNCAGSLVISWSLGKCHQFSPVGAISNSVTSTPLAIEHNTRTGLPCISLEQHELNLFTVDLVLTETYGELGSPSSGAGDRSVREDGIRQEVRLHLVLAGLRVEAKPPS